MMSEKKEDKFDFGDLYQIIDYIGEKHFLLLEPKLDLLFSYISAIQYVSHSGEVNIRNVQAFEKFDQFIFDKMGLKQGNTMGWFGAIVNEYGKERKGFDKFFEFYMEFRKDSME